MLLRRWHPEAQGGIIGQNERPAMTDPIRHDRIPELALNWLRVGRGVALATVVETWGSAPRSPGSQMVVDAAGAMMGSISGGCVEAAVVAEAMATIADRQPRLQTYGVSDDDAFAVGLACGGTIRVLIEPVGPGALALPEALLAELVASRAKPEARALITDLADFSRHLVSLGIDAQIDARFTADRSGPDSGSDSGPDSGPDVDRFIAIHNPPLRLFVVGGVQIAQALLPMARACGHAVTLIDPRSAFGTAARFPGEAIVEDWPDAALRALNPDARSAIVTLTHDAKLDDPAIAFALRSPVYYLGCLGSSRTHAKRLERLRVMGFSEAELTRIHAPAGLNIGAKSPAEIALSILAELTATLRLRP